MPVRAFLILLIDKFVISEKFCKAQHLLSSMVHDAVPWACKSQSYRCSSYTVLAEAMLSRGSSSSSCKIAWSSLRLRASLVMGWKVHSFMEADRMLACSCALLLAVSSCTASKRSIPHTCRGGTKYAKYGAKIFMKFSKQPWSKRLHIGL